MKHTFLVLPVVLAVAMPALAARNMLANGNFTKGRKVEGDDAWTIPGWHVRLADWKQGHVQRAGDKRTYNYSCGCGHPLPVRPWAGLICPGCKGFFGGEESGSWYIQNHTRVDLTGGSLHFKLSRDVGNNQGVRVFSKMFRVKRGWGYKLRFRVRTKGSHARVFVEGWRTTTQADYVYDEKMKEMDPYGIKHPVEKCYRAQVNCTGTSSWKTFTKEFVPPKRYWYDWASVKLYAYMPGEAWFDDVIVVPMTPGEMDRYMTSKRKPKDGRFKR